MVPPVSTLVQGLLALGHEVTFFTYYTDPALQPVGQAGFRLVRASERPYPSGIGARIRGTIQLYRSLFHLIRADPQAFDVLWDANGDIEYALQVIRRAGSRAPLVAQVHEYEARAFRSVRQAQALVVPEENRGWLLALAAGRRHSPLVLPNTPLTQLRQDQRPTGPAMRIRELRAAGKQVVLYQGFVDAARRCLPELFASLRHLPDDIVLAVMPAPGHSATELAMIESLARTAGVSDRVVRLETELPPQHLGAIAEASAGVGLYRPTSINQIFCAPNRLYECTGFGVPIVLPAFPGIRPLAERCAGILVCDPEDPESIASAIRNAVDPRRHDQRRAAARDFFERDGNYLTHLDRVVSRLPVPQPTGS